MATSREIIKAIVGEKRCPERMGLFEHYWSDTIDEWKKQGYPDGANPVEYFNYDLDGVDGTWFDTSPFPGEGKVIEEDEETRIEVNGWGAKARNWKKKSGTPEHIGFDLTSSEIWRKKYREPLLGLNVKRLGDLDKIRAEYKKKMASSRFIYFSNVTIFEIMRGSMGDVTMLESMYTDPDWILDFCDLVTNTLITHYDYLYREMGKPDGMFIYEDMGYTQAPFISPEMQRELIMPFHKRLVSFFHDNGLPIIMHSCGKIRPFLPAIVEAGVDCLQVLEAKAGQHVAEFAEATGNKIAFMGNLNIQAFETNDRKVIDAEVLPKLEAIRKNRIPFVFHSDHSIPRTVSLDTYRYALDLWKKHGRY